ncbi:MULTISPECIES: hypothetical protein [Enterobacter]|jgi:hypothetical protein|uniref:hypothetical protein n=1 Tax=Enterobacter TaxID=547 RepID=UPI0020055E0F|nr:MULTISPECIES: hypothetical protein [Enterobacter]MCK7244518.1 hypothetical protein [Enterobacter asburiae]MCM7768480.1 hypothetical protein [Enterobacter bugandensis]BEK73379.1 hypothetical protein EATA6166_12710 [Enterobacter asburiae]
MAWYDITGTVADWVMAGAAGYAAFLAKNWIKPNLQQQGLSKVVNFLQQDISNLATLRIEYIYIKSIVRNIEWLKGNIDFMPGEKQKRLRGVCDDIKNDIIPKKTNIKIKNINEFKTALKELQWYGYSFKKEKLQLIEELYKLKNENDNTINSIVMYVDKLGSTEVMESFMFSEKKNSNEVFKKLDEIISGLNSYEEKHEEDYKQLKNIKAKILSENPLVTDFFELKR